MGPLPAAPRGLGREGRADGRHPGCRC